VTHQVNQHQYCRTSHYNRLRVDFYCDEEQCVAMRFRAPSITNGSHQQWTTISDNAILAKALSQTNNSSSIWIDGRFVEWQTESKRNPPVPEGQTCFPGPTSGNSISTTHSHTGRTCVSKPQQMRNTSKETGPNGCYTYATLGKLLFHLCGEDTGLNPVGKEFSQNLWIHFPSDLIIQCSLSSRTPLGGLGTY
jgi:hypothetical protein